MFRNYSDVFIWFSLMNKCSDYINCTFIQNEIKLDWWNSTSDDINDTMRLEWDEVNPKCNFVMTNLEELINKAVESNDFDVNFASEVLKMKEDIDNISSTEYYVKYFEDYLSGEMEDRYYNDFLEKFYNDALLDWGSPEEVDIDLDSPTLNKVTILEPIDFRDKIINVVFEINIDFTAHGMKYISKDHSENFQGNGLYVLTLDYDFDIVFGENNVSASFNYGKEKIDISFEEEYEDETIYDFEEF